MIKFEMMLDVSYKELRSGLVGGMKLYTPDWQREDRWSKNKHAAAERAINEGAFLPPIVLAKMGNEFLVVDGGHRLRKIQSDACKNAQGRIGAVVVSVGNMDEAKEVFYTVNDGTKVSKADKDFAANPSASKRELRAALQAMWPKASASRVATAIHELFKIYQDGERVSWALDVIDRYCDPSQTTNKHIAAALILDRLKKKPSEVEFDEFVDSLEKLPGRTNNEITAWLADPVKPSVKLAK